MNPIQSPSKRLKSVNIATCKRLLFSAHILRWTAGRLVLELDRSRAAIAVSDSFTLGVPTYGRNTCLLMKDTGSTDPHPSRHFLQPYI